MAIHASGEYTLQDYRHARRLQRRPQRFRRIFRNVILAAVVTWLVYQSLHGDRGAIVVVSFFVGTMYVSFVYWYVVQRQLRKQWQSPVMQGRHHTSIDDQEICCSKDDVYENHWRWTAFNGMAESKEIVVLMLTNVRMLIFPRRFFTTDADWQAFRLEARRHAGKCRKCGYLLRGTISETCPECGTPLVPEAVGEASA